MLFNSFEFIFVFLPIVFIIYFILTKYRLITTSKTWIILSSLFFYSWWNVSYLSLIILSMLFNYCLGLILSKEQGIKYRKVLLIFGIIFNVSLLTYFKYADFFLSNINYFFTSNLPLLELVLPLAISFFTFQQIAFLVDTYRHETKRYSFLDYLFFISFFPQLIAGPIVYHKDMMPQFESLKNKSIDYKNITLGIFIFSIGLFKKVVIADSFAVWVNQGFSNSEYLTFIEAWIVSLSYTFQLYFDFSGYADMAIGAALLFNIYLPINFNSPYKALSITEFWKRWHITLTNFLTKYIYIPLGGNRKGINRTYINILIIFLLSGLWHGAGWTFVFWGLMHGLASLVNRYWQSLNIKMNKYLAWLITFNFVNFAWVFFRADTWNEAIDILKGMLGLNGFKLEINSSALLTEGTILIYALLLILACFIIVLFFKNSSQIINTSKHNLLFIGFIACLITITVYFSFTSFSNSEFIYFNF